MIRNLSLAAVAAATLTACGPVATGPVDPLAQIPTGGYVLFNIGGEVLSTRHTTIDVQPGGITGRTGCNNFAVPTSGTPPELSVGEIQTTGLTCRWSDQETRFFNALRQANRITYEDGVLRISGGPATLTFEYGTLATPPGPIGRNLQ
ncbi:MAG: META domain-containing protein [Paracoccus sp. (in: a-proteobacteria)]|nr:META domain-containing protein [Paracoccus sp. (in: a-proteobacteria)]